MTVSVVIPAYCSAQFISLCLDSLKRQTFPAHEIIVVDDASTDTTALLARQSGVKVFQLPENRGTAYARTYGAEKATGKIVAFLDSDCVASPEWIETIVHEFEEDQSLSGVGGGYAHFRSQQSIALLAKLEEEYAHHLSAQKPFTANPPGGNLAFLRKVWLEGRSGCEVFLFRGITGGEDSVACNEIRETAKIKFSTNLSVTHLPLKTHGYFRRHVNRGRSGAFKKTLNLKADVDDGLNAYGGYRLFFGTVCLWLALLTLILTTFNTAIIYTTPICLILFSVLSRDFAGFIKKTNQSLPADEKISTLEKITLFGLISIRSLCWVYGALLFWFQWGISYLRKQVNIILSILHFWQPGRISKMFYFVTAHCNARCEFCFNLDNVINWKERRPVELTLKEVEKITCHLKRMPYLIISGGEPFMRKDLVDIITAFYRNCKTQWVTIPTNASLTKATLEMTQEILTRCPNLFLTIQISLDGMHETHDQSRKISGGFEAMNKTFEKISVLFRWYPNLRVQIATCYDDFNITQINEMTRFCRDNFKYDQQIFYLVRETTKLITDSKNHLLPSFLHTVAENEAYEWAHHRKGLWHRAARVLQNLVYSDIVTIKTRKELVRYCHATRKFITLYDDGKISPCEILETVNLGNIREYNYDFYRLISQPQAKKFYKDDIIGNQCNCDWMCATPINMLYDPRMIPRVIKALITLDKTT